MPPFVAIVTSLDKGLIMVAAVPPDAQGIAQPRAGAGEHLLPGEIAARIDRLPLAAVQWRLALITQATYGFVISADGTAARLWPFIWQPKGAFSSLEYTILYMVQVGIGLFLGEWLFGYLSDRLGRRRMLITAVTIAGVFLIPMALVDNYVLLLLASVISSMGIGGMLAINVVYMEEIAPPRVRARVSQGSQVLAIVLSGVVPGVLAQHLIPGNYRLWIYLLAGLILLIDVPLLVFGLPESPRWLEGRGRGADARKVLEHIERLSARGGRVLPEPDLAGHVVVSAKKVSVKELFGSVYGRRAILLLACWTLIYAGCVYGFAEYAFEYLVVKGLSASDVFLVITIGSGAGGGVALLVLALIGERLERKTVIFGGSILYAAGMLVFAVTSGAVAAGIGAAVAFAALPVMFTNLYVYTATAFPTRMRSVGTGWTDGVGHNGAVWGPFVATALFNATLTDHAWAWVLWCAVPGALVPGILMLVFGTRQRGRALEELSR
jgi:putative MFS transporter